MVEWIPRKRLDYNESETENKRRVEKLINQFDINT